MKLALAAMIGFALGLLFSWLSLASALAAGTVRRAALRLCHPVMVARAERLSRLRRFFGELVEPHEMPRRRRLNGEAQQ